MSKLRKLLLLLLALSFVGVIGFAGGYVYYLHRSLTVVMPNAYATDWTAEFVIEHLKANDNHWPKGWEDLRVEFDRLAEPNHYPWSWEELKSRITIDWQADPAALAAANATADPPFRVIRLTDGTNSYFVNGEPNRQVHDYLRTTDLANQQKSD